MQISLKRALLPAVMVGVVGVSLPPAQAQQASPACSVLDPSCHNLKCYKIGGPVLAEPLQLDDQFGRERVFKLVPQFLCNPALKSCCLKKADGTFDCSSISPDNCPPDPSQPNGSVAVDHFKCYKIVVKECPPSPTSAGGFDCTNLTGRFPPIPPPIQVLLLDQFHQEKVNVGPPKMLCVPVLKRVTSPTTTTIVTTTTTTTFRCGGCAPCGSTCAGHGECHVAGGGGGCGAPSTNPVCVDATMCTPSTCSTDADCPGGRVCVFKDGPSECCAPCP